MKSENARALLECQLDALIRQYEKHLKPETVKATAGSLSKVFGVVAKNVSFAPMLVRGVDHALSSPSKTPFLNLALKQYLSHCVVDDVKAVQRHFVKARKDLKFSAEEDEDDKTKADEALKEFEGALARYSSRKSMGSGASIASATSVAGSPGARSAGGESKDSPMRSVGGKGSAKARERKEEQSSRSASPAPPRQAKSRAAVSGDEIDEKHVEKETVPREAAQAPASQRKRRSSSSLAAASPAKKQRSKRVESDDEQETPADEDDKADKEVEEASRKLRSGRKKTQDLD